MAKPDHVEPMASPADAAEAGAASRFLRYADYLEHQIANAPKRTKGARTKDALKLGAIRVLDDVGYHAMRVSDICEAAGVALATFYLYFTNKSDITLQVLSEYLEQGMGMLAARDGARTAFDSIRGANLRWLQGIRANAGLSRCITQLGDEEPGFRELAHRINRQWYERIAQSFVRRFPGPVSEDVVLLAAYSLGAMMDEMARKLVVYPDPALLTLVGKIAPSDGEIADFLTVLWYRALYGAAPSEANLGPAARAIGELGVPTP
jgi:TetR/AcrR family transcriptional regulator, transcriptional repressor for nem operon